MTTKRQEGIAVIGLGALFPGSTNRHGFWRDILAGKDLVTDVPASHWLIEDYYDPDPTAPDKTYGKRGAFLPTVDFDPVHFAMPPSNLPSTDTSQLLALIVAQQVLEDAAGSQFAEMDRERISVILGVASTTELVVELGSRLQRPIWVKALREQGLPEEEVQAACDRISASYVPWTESSFPGLLGNVVAGRIANRFDLGGTNCVVDAACASSLSALHLGLLELHAGTSDLVIAGGVDTLNDILMYECFSKTPALSATGDARPFSAEADGTILGEGIGMVALKRLEDAERDGDRVYAVLRGLGTSSDGRSKSIYAPVSSGQAKALRRAYAAAGYGPETVELVEAHGTATRAGDAAEFEALRMAFTGEVAGPTQRCALGSVKSQIGHTKAAAGAAGLFKAVMALHHKILPPTIKVDLPNPNLDLAHSPFYLNTAARPWIRGSAHPRRASVSSFGFGGSNYHVTMEEYVGPGQRRARSRSFPAELVLLASDTAEALVSECRAVAGDVPDEGGLQYWAHRTQTGHRDRGEHRLALVAGSESELRDLLGKAASRIEASPGESFSLPGGAYYGSGDAQGQVAFLFPGQGSQRVGMGDTLAMHFDQARLVWDEAASLPFGDAGDRLHDVVFPIPAFTAEDRDAQRARIAATEWAQPALAAVSLSYLTLLREAGVEADFLGGHSFGEVTSLFAAGVLDRTDLLRAARRRGELMAAAATTPGAMVAVTGTLGDLVAQIAHEGIDVVAANHNGPHQVVFSGGVEAIEALEKRLAGVPGISTVRLPVSTAFHSPIVSSSVAPFRAFLEEVPFGEPAVPVYANTTADRYPTDPDAARDLLSQQLAEPVRFSDQVEAMYGAGARVFIEVGPATVLTGMVGKILGGRPHTAVAVERKGMSTITSLWHLFGRLFAEGIHASPGSIWKEYEVPEDPREARKAALVVPINGANYGKPYPPPGGSAALPPPNPPREVPRNDRTQPPAQPSAQEQAPFMPDHAVGPTNGAGRLDPSPAKGPHGGSNGSAPAPEPTSAQVEAILEMHRETAAAHTAYISAMAETHRTYLTAMSGAIGSLGGGADASGLATGTDDLEPAQVAPPAPPARERTEVTPPVRSATQDARPRTEVAEAEPAPAPPTLSSTTPEGGSAPAGLQDLLLKVVAEKTGYPVEMLGLELELEAGLGIDSIKRVEILSALREQAPDLPEVEPAQLASLRTLQEIITFMGRNGVEVTLPSTDIEVAAPGSGPAETGDAAAPTVGGQTGVEDLTALLLAVVAEKTGYPVEMLDLSLELESGLGIDSIKRVEILSALRDQVPDLPEVQPAQLASLRTLNEIIAFMQGDAAGTPANTKAGTNGTAPVHQEAPEPSADSELRPLDRYSVRAAPAPAAGLAIPGLLGSRGTIAIIEDGRGIAPLLAERLAAYDIVAECVSSVPSDAAGVIHLAGLRDFPDDEAALAVNQEVFVAARAVAERFSVEGGLFVTVQDTGGDFGLSGLQPTRQWSAGLTGLAKTAAREWPLAAVKAIDLASEDRTAEALAGEIAGELLFGGPELEVGLSPRLGRVTLICEPSAVPADGAPAIGPDDVVVATGGARGVTATCLRALARSCHPRIALLGRTPLEPEPLGQAAAMDEAALRTYLIEEATEAGDRPTPAEIGRRVGAILAAREVAQNIAALQEAGSEVLYLPCDASDEAAVVAALDEVRNQWGPITALVHGAGVLADKLIAEKSDEQFQRVFAAKVGGLRALTQATAEDPLRTILLFSSVAARTGNVGQSDYAMANEILNRWAAAEGARRPDCLIRSLGWGPWDGGMVTPALRAHFESLGVGLIAPSEGADAFVSEFLSPGPSEVVLGHGSPDAALGSGSGRNWIMDVLVSAETYPALSSHRVQDVPVLPVVLVVEWLVRAARACYPGRGMPRISDLRVFRGVRLKQYTGPGDRLVLHLSETVQEGRSSLRMELRHPDGALHYAATADFTARDQDPVPDAGEMEFEESAWRAADLYGDQLFHGPDFQAIRTLEGFSREGASAILAGARELGWNGEWRTDVVAMDGGLQLARLWGIHTFGKPSLPTRIASITIHQETPVEGPIRCVVRMGSAEKLRTVSDIALILEDGRLVAELQGVEMHMLQGEAVAE